MMFAEQIHTEIIELNPDRCVAETFVSEPMLQPSGAIHGGVSAYLAEHVANTAVRELMEQDGEPGLAVGLELSSSHLLPVFEGDTIQTVATPIRNGGRIRVWEIQQFRKSDGQLFNKSQLTMYITHRQ